MFHILDLDSKCEEFCLCEGTSNYLLDSYGISKYIYISRWELKLELFPRTVWIYIAFHIAERVKLPGNFYLVTTNHYRQPKHITGNQNILPRTDIMYERN